MLRVVFVLLGVAMLFAVGAEAASGEFTAHAASGNHTRSLATLRTLSWSEAPWLYALAVAFYSGLFLLFVFGAYLVFEKFTRRWHGRPFFKRKYPY